MRQRKFSGFQHLRQISTGRTGRFNKYVHQSILDGKVTPGVFEEPGDHVELRWDDDQSIGIVHESDLEKVTEP